MQSGTKDEQKSHEAQSKATGMALWLSLMHLERLHGERGPKIFRPVLNSTKSGETDEKRKTR